VFTLGDPSEPHVLISEREVEGWDRENVMSQRMEWCNCWKGAPRYQKKVLPCTQAGLELIILLLQCPKCWDYRCKPLCPVKVKFAAIGVYI
jgi:hypothetical protein